MLPTGANIAIVAPSGIFNLQRLQQGIQILESWGYRTSLSPNIHSTHLSMAGTSKERHSDLEWAHERKDIDALWFARGGYGTVEVLAQLPAITKPIFGFSDATAMACLMHQRGLQNFFHAPVVHSLASLCDSKSTTALKTALLNGDLPSFRLKNLQSPIEQPLNAPIVGGNLCVIASLSGTPFALKARNCILMLEDIGEPAYKIHRMLVQLKLSGTLDGVKAIVLGSFTNCSTPSPYSLEHYILDGLADPDLPVYTGADFGHEENNLIWNVNRTYTLKGEVLQCGQQ